MDKNHILKLGRRRFLQAAVALGGMPLVRVMPAWAEDHAPLGTYPAGVAGETAFVGVTVPLTGPYAAAGDDILHGYELAFDHLNHGGGLVDTIPTLSGKGVLGKRVIYKVDDSQTQPNPAVESQTRFITKDKAILMTGSISSATAIALEKLAQREKVLYMTGTTNSNDTTGKDCQRYGFRNQTSAYMVSVAMAPVLAQELGRKRKAIYLIPDYTYGHSMFDSFSHFTEKEGWTTVGKQAVPVGTTDFSSYLINIANSGADVLVNVMFGDDANASTKQAQQFGIFKKVKMVLPGISPFQAKEVGADLMGGVYGSVDFWWTMSEMIPAAKIFVDTFEAKYHYKPEWSAQIGYSQMIIWADAVERAKTFYPPAVIKALEAGHKLALPIGTGYYRACDHQMVRGVPVVVGKKSSEMRGPDDFYRIIKIVPGEDSVPACSESACKLGSYT